MKPTTLIAASLLIVYNGKLPQSESIEPVTIGIGALVVVGLGVLFVVVKEPTEQCHDRSCNDWIIYEPDFTRTQHRMFGQHIAVSDALRNIKQHLADDHPQKALVLSFHGDTGVGKTFLAENIAATLYHNYSRSGKSQFVHKLMATHFLASDTSSKRRRMMTFIQNGLIKCERSLFILEEVDKYPTKFLDNLIPYVESSVVINGRTYDGRKSIFILLSNSDGHVINNFMAETRAKKISRYQIGYNHFEQLITSKAFTSKGGLQDSELISRSFLRVVPFLPLEHGHVKQCVAQYLREHRGYTNPDVVPGYDFITHAADELIYTEDGYSKYGCRPVPDRVGALL